MPNKLTDAEIKKALECCAESGDFTKTQDEICSPCPYCNCGDCTGILKANALDLINRQEEKNSNLQEKNSNLTSDLTSLQNDLTSAKAEVERLKDDNKFLQDNRWKELSFVKAEAYKECLDELARRLGYAFLSKHSCVLDIMENLLNELVGDTDGKNL